MALVTIAWCWVSCFMHSCMATTILCFQFVRAVIHQETCTFASPATFWFWRHIVDEAARRSEGRSSKKRNRKRRAKRLFAQFKHNSMFASSVHAIIEAHERVSKKSPPTVSRRSLSPAQSSQPAPRDRSPRAGDAAGVGFARAMECPSPPHDEDPFFLEALRSQMKVMYSNKLLACSSRHLQSRMTTKALNMMLVLHLEIKIP